METNPRFEKGVHKGEATCSSKAHVNEFQCTLINIGDTFPEQVSEDCSPMIAPSVL